MLTPRILLLGVLLPTMLGLGLALVLARVGRPDPERGGWRAGLVLAAGYAVGHVAALGWPPFPPVQAEDWIFWLLPAAVVVALLEGVFQASAPTVRVVLRLVVLGLLVGLVTRPLIAHTWSTQAAALWLPSLVALALILWLGVYLTAVRSPGAGSWLAASAVAGGTGLAAGIGGSQALAELSGGLAAASGGAFLVALTSRGLGFGRPAALVPTTILSGVLISACFYAELHPAAALLLVAAPLAGAAVPAAWTDGRPALVRALITAAAVAVPVAAAIVVAVLTAPPLDPYAGYEG